MRFLQGALVIFGPLASRISGLSGSDYKLRVFLAPLSTLVIQMVHEKSSRVRPCVLELFPPQDSL